MVGRRVSGGWSACWLRTWGAEEVVDCCTGAIDVFGGLDGGGGDAAARAEVEGVMTRDLH